MTIDEAIEHAREVAEEQRIKNKVCGNCKYCVKGQIHPRQGYCYFNVIHYEHDLSRKACSNWESNDNIGCECAEEHEQLAEWLEELKALRERTQIQAEGLTDAYLLGKYDGIKQGRADAIEEFAHALKETFNNEFPSNYHCTKPYFTLDNVRVLVDLVAKEQKNE